MKRNTRFITNLFTLLLAGISFLFLTCDIGLGSSVDTQPPTISISYPPAASVIRNSFIVAGYTNDETSIKSVVVTLRNRSTNNVVGSWGATVNNDAEYWEVDIPNAVIPETGKSPIPDGDYELTAEATDTADRKTSVKTTYILDNTAPTLVVTQPATKGDAAPYEFGSELTLTGMWYDANNVDKILFTFYDENGTKVTDYSYPNPLPNFEINLKNTSDVFQKLQDAMAIQGSAQKFWYSAVMTDTAFEYRDPKGTARAAMKGNSAGYYYEWGGITSLLQLGDFAPRISALYKIDNSLPVSSDEAPSSITPDSLRGLRIASEDAKFDTTKNGNFSIDPTNTDPEVKIDGLTYGVPSTGNQIALKSLLRIEIYMGKDNSPILADDIYVTLYNLDASGNKGSVAQAKKKVSGAAGNPIVISYSIDADAGNYLIEVEAKDLTGKAARRGSYKFTVNGGAPSLVLSPGSTSSVKVASGTDGKFKAVVKAIDDNDTLSLTVQEDLGGGNVITSPSDMKLVSGPVKGTEGTRNTFTWTYTFTAAPEGSERDLLFTVTDGKFDTRIARSFITDNTTPELRGLDKPVLKTEGPATGKAVVPEKGIEVRGWADSDLTRALICYTTADTKPADSYAGWTVADIDGFITERSGRQVRGFTSNMVLTPDAGNPEESMYYLWVRFADETWDAVTNQMGPIHKLATVMVDKNDPELTETTLTSPVEYTGKVYKNAAYSLGGSITDANGIYSLTVTPSLNGTAQAPVKITPANGKWSFAQSTLTEGNWSFAVSATDAAGKTVTLTREVLMDKTPPVISVSKPEENGFINTSSYTFEGSVTDSGSGTAAVEISFDGTNWITPNGTDSWLYVKDFPADEREGTRTVYVRAKDRAGNAPAVFERHFSLDKNPPAITETSIADATLKYIEGNAWAFTGTASDTNGVKSVTVTIIKDGGNPSAPQTLTTNAGNWTYNASALTSGTYEFTFTVQDNALRTTNVTRKLFVDIEKPVIEINSILPTVTISGSEYVNGTIEVKGRASDDDRINSVWWTVSAGDSSWTQFTATAVTDSATGNTAVMDGSGKFTVSNIDTTKALNIVNGKLALRLKAIDRAGNVTILAVNPIVDQESDKPSLEPRNLDNTAANAVPGVSGGREVNIFGRISNNLLRFDVSDDDGVGKVWVKYGATPADAAAAAYPADPAAVFASQPVSGSFTYSLAPLAEGVYSFYVRVADKYFTDATATPNSYRDCGPYNIAIDESVPVITITSPVQNDWAGSELVIKGTAGDGAGVVSVTTNGSPLIGEDNAPYTPAFAPNVTGEWVHKYVIPASATSPYSISFTATDKFGRTATAVLNYKLDRDKPSVSIASGLEGPFYINMATPILKLTGTAEDPQITGKDRSGLSEVRYAVVRDKPDAPAAPPPFSSDKWFAAAGIGSWTANIDLTAGSITGIDNDEGTYKVYIASRDVAGNWSDITAAQTRVFHTDMQAPVIGSTVTADPASSSAKNNLFNRTFRISGTASDTAGLAEITAVLKNGKKLPLKSPALAAGAASYAWTFEVPLTAEYFPDGSGGVKDGEYDITITAADKSGQTASITWTFSIDGNAPKIDFSNLTPASGSGMVSFTDSAPRVLGTFSDSASGMRKISYLFQKKSGGAYSPASPGAADITTAYTGIAEGAASGSISITVPGLAANTDGVYRLVLIAEDMAGNVSSVITSPEFLIDQHLPDLNITLPQLKKIVQKGDKLEVSGTATDTNGGSLAYVEIAVTHPSFSQAEKNEYTKKVTAAEMSGSTWSWSLPAGSSSPYKYDDDYTITVTAVDTAGNRREQTRSVSCDNTPPSLTFKRPFLMSPGSSGTSQTSPVIGEVIVEGTADDFSMRSVYYQIGGTVNTATDTLGSITSVHISGAGLTASSGAVEPGADTGLTGLWVKSSDNYGWSFTANTLAYQDLAEPTPGAGADNFKTLYMYVAAVDEAGNIQLAKYPVNIDTDIDKPTVEILSPDINSITEAGDRAAQVGGSFIVSGGAADNNYVQSVFMQVEIAHGNYVNGTLTANDGTGTFPGVAVSGGRNAQQIKNNTGGDVPYFTKTGSGLDAWYRVDGQSAWKFTLNKNGEFFNKNLKKYYTNEYINDVSASGYQDSKLAEVTVRVMVLDTKNSDGTLSSDCKFGEIKEMKILIDQDAPGIAVISLPEQNTFVSGMIPFHIALNDDGAVDRFTVTANESHTIDTSSFIITPALPAKNCDVSGQLDSAALSRLCNTNVITLKLEVFDNEGKTSAISRKFTVDNTPPRDVNGGKLQTETGDGSNPREPGDRGGHLRVMSTEAILQSKVADETNGSDIKAVILYFTRTVNGQTRMYSMGGVSQDTLGTQLTNTITLPFIQANNTVTTKQVPFPESSLAAIKLKDNPPTSYIVVDTAEGGDDNGYNGDGDGYGENLRSTGEWFVKLNSTKVRDGIYTIHYIVMDKAGNAMYYEDSMLVQNSGPKIQSVLLATDVNGDGTVNTDETAGTSFEGKVFTPREFASTGFAVRNNRLTVKVNATGDNTPLKYYLKYPTSGGGSATLQNATGVFEITNFPAEISDPTSASYSVWVEDSVEPVLSLSSGTAALSLLLKNIDKEAPTAKLYEFNTKSEYSATAAIAGLGKNETMGSLYYTDSTSEVYSGHIELRADSPFNNTTVNDPDVSGKIILRGFAQDNQRITAVRLVLGSETVTILQGGSLGRLEAATDGVTVYDELTLDGHRAEWSYVWNTAVTGTSAQNMVGTDVRVQVIIEDARKEGGVSAPNKNAVQTYTNGASAYNDMTVDVVPYIRKIETAKRSGSGLKNNNIRSASGKYSILQGNTADFITVRGFNLAPMTDGVRIVTSTTAADRDGLVGNTTTLAGIPIAFSQASSDGTMLTLSNNSSKSGYLAVVGGTAAKPIPALNNVNNNDAKDSGNLVQNLPFAYNREPDRYMTMNTLLTDDRYLQFFTVKDTGVKNGYYPTMIMDGDDPVFGYLDLKGGTSGEAGNYYPSHAMPQRAKFNGQTGARINAEYLIKASIWDQMGMARDDSGRYIQASVYNRDGGGMALIYDKYASLYSGGKGWGAGTGYQGYDGNSANDTRNNAISLENVNYGSLMLDRYKYPLLIAKGNSVTDYAAVYMLYFDDNTANRELVFRNLQIGTNGGNRNTQLYSGGTGSDGTRFQQYTNFTENTGNSGSWESGRLTAATNASQYFDMGITSDNRVVIVYYDESESTLKLKYSNAPVVGANPTGNVSWTTSSVSFPAYTGTYVSMTIDQNDRIHIAAYDANEADLVYMFLPSYSSPNVKTVIVDSTGSVGLWTQVKVKNSVPYIAYYNSSETGTRDSLKLAYANKAIGGTVDVLPGTDSGLTTGNWEYMTVPAATPPQGGIPKFQRVNLGFDTAGKPVLGYLGTNIEFATIVTE